MREYKILLTDSAILDLDNTYDYIYYHYASPIDAEKWRNAIKF